MDESTPLLVEAVDGQRHDDAENDGPLRTEHDLPANDAANWSLSFKWCIVGLLALSAFTVTFGCLSVAPIATHIVDELDGEDENKSSAVLLVTIWELGEAVGPLLIAPLSEMYGRRPLFHAANTVFIVTTMLASFSRSSTELLMMRALTGMAVASAVLNPAVVGDIFAPEQRGAALSCIMFAPLLASSVGVAFSSVLAAKFGWRSVLWLSAGLTGVCEFCFMTWFPETYPGRARQAAKPLRYEGPPEMMHNATYKKASAESISLWTTIKRPFAVFINSGVLAALSLFGAVVFCYFYVISVTLPIILEDVYEFPPSMTGTAFLPNGVGTCIGVVICNLSLDRIYTKLKRKNNGFGLPEFRLPLTIVGVLSMPPAIALYGWCAELQLPLGLFLFSTAWMRVSMALASIPLYSYVVDAYGLYSASALTGVIVVRCLAGAFFPLATSGMIDVLGYGMGFTVLGIITMAVGVIPMLVLRYGSRWRQRSKYTNTM
jgi:MFS family permease